MKKSEIVERVSSEVGVMKRAADAATKEFLAVRTEAGTGVRHRLIHDIFDTVISFGLKTKLTSNY